MRSVLRRFSDSSTTFWMCSGRLSSPIAPSILKPNLLAITTLSRERRERFSDKLFVCIWAVNFGRIKERDAFFIGCTNDLNALVSVCGGSVVGADVHAPESYFLNLPCSTFSCFH